MEIIPTLVPRSFEDVRNAAERYSFARTIHIDAGDGRFVSNTTWQPAEGETLPTMLSWDAHLMVHEPLASGVLYAKAGASRIIAHLETFEDHSAIPAAFEAWKAAGAREVGLAVKIETSFEGLAPYTSLCDSIVLMTIATMGQQGSPFDPRGIERVKMLRGQFPGIMIAADGGINEMNIGDLAKAGATRFYVGSALSSSPDPAVVHKRLLDAVETIQ